MPVGKQSRSNGRDFRLTQGLPNQVETLPSVESRRSVMRMAGSVLPRRRISSSSSIPLISGMWRSRIRQSRFRRPRMASRRLPVRQRRKRGRRCSRRREIPDRRRIRELQSPRTRAEAEANPVLRHHRPDSRSSAVSIRSALPFFCGRHVAALIWIMGPDGQAGGPSSP